VIARGHQLLVGAVLIDCWYTFPSITNSTRVGGRPTHAEGRLEHAVGQLMDREAKPGILERRQARPSSRRTPPAATSCTVDDRAVARPGRDRDGEVGAERLVQRIS